jgi:hypothetical protein
MNSNIELLKQFLGKITISDDYTGEGTTSKTSDQKVNNKKTNILNTTNEIRYDKENKKESRRSFINFIENEIVPKNIQKNASENKKEEKKQNKEDKTNNKTNKKDDKTNESKLIEIIDMLNEEDINSDQIDFNIDMLDLTKLEAIDLPTDLDIFDKNLPTNSNEDDDSVFDNDILEDESNDKDNDIDD